MAKKTYQEQIQNSYLDYPIVKPIAQNMIKTFKKGKNKMIFAVR